MVANQIMGVRRYVEKVKMASHIGGTIAVDSNESKFN